MSGYYKTDQSLAELIKINDDTRFFASKELRTVLKQMLTENKITYDDFSKKCFKMLDDKQMSVDYAHFRNDLIGAICMKNRNLTYNKFVFIIEDILKLPLPDMPTIIKLASNNSRITNLIGRRFGKLKVIECSGKSRNNVNVYWLCDCDCGKTDIEIPTNNLLSGNSLSCGCAIHDILIKRNTTHGKRHSPEYKPWAGMIQRCTNPNEKAYKSYGGRGIKVCDRWRHSFENFYEDMGPKPEGKSLDRIEVNGNYEPGNCHWATFEEQINNQRKSVKLEGIPAKRWSKDNKICYTSVLICVRKGLSPDEIRKKYKK